MSPERRKQYFNNLLKSGGGSEPVSSESLNSAGSNEDFGEQRPSRVNKNWSRLRTGWKDAVKAELSTGFDQWEAQRNRNAFWAMMAANYTLNT